MIIVIIIIVINNNNSNNKHIATATAHTHSTITIPIMVFVIIIWTKMLSAHIFLPLMCAHPCARVAHVDSFLSFIHFLCHSFSHSVSCSSVTTCVFSFHDSPLNSVWKIPRILSKCEIDTNTHKHTLKTKKNTLTHIVHSECARNIIYTHIELCKPIEFNYLEFFLC